MNPIRPSRHPAEAANMPINVQWQPAVACRPSDRQSDREVIAYSMSEAGRFAMLGNSSSTRWS